MWQVSLRNGISLLPDILYVQLTQYHMTVIKYSFSYYNQKVVIKTHEILLASKILKKSFRKQQ